MYNWHEHNKLKSILSQDSLYSEIYGGHEIHCRPLNLFRWVEFLKNDLGFLQLSDISTNEKLGIRTYSFYHLETSQRVFLHLEIRAGENAPSIAHYYANAQFLENEKQIVSASSQGLMKCPEVKFNPNRSEKPYIEESYQWEKFDLFSDLTQKHMELITCSFDSKVLEVQSDIGFHRKGIESSFSNKSFDDVLLAIDSINIEIAPTYSILFAKSIEEFSRIKVPQRAQAIRTIQLEIARIVEHLKIVRATFVSVENNEVLPLYKFKFELIDLLRKLSINENKVSVIIGGVSQDVPYGWINEYRMLSESFIKELELFHKMIQKNEKIKTLLKQGGVNPKDIIRNGISGPNMRASGINFDYRKSNPFYFYSEIDFDVPVEVNGTSWDRYLIRYQEIIESMSIVNQVVDNLPLGDFSSNELDFVTPKAPVYFSSFLEAPQGITGVSWYIDQNSRLDSFRIITPHFALSQSLGFMLKDVQKTDLKPHFASLGLNSIEIDR